MSTKARLLESAKELFSQKGYHETKVSDIVSRAGLSQGAFYFYFKSKEDIFKELVNIMSHKFIKLLEECVKKRDHVEDIIRNSIIDFSKIMYEERYIAYIFLFQLVGTNEEFRRMYFEKTGRIRKLLMEILSKGVESGLFKYKNVENLANLIMGYVRIIYLDYLIKEKVELEKFVELINEGIEIIFRGIRG
ncbi:MAG: TetR/AcrR family transcriptional regulator [Aquificaceae bacterium]